MGAACEMASNARLLPFSNPHLNPRAQRVHAVAALLAEVGVLAPEVAVCGCLAVDRATEVQIADDGAGAQIEDLADRPLD